MIDCYEKKIIGRWDGNQITLGRQQSDPIPFKEYWNITTSKSSRPHSDTFPEGRFDSVTFNTDGSYVLTDKGFFGDTRLVTLEVNTGVEVEGGMHLAYIFEEHGSYEIGSDHGDSGSGFIRFFPERIETRFEDDAYFMTFPEGTKIDLDVDPLNEWLSRVGIYGDTMIATGWRVKYSGEEVYFRNLDLEFDCP